MDSAQVQVAPDLPEVTEVAAPAVYEAEPVKWVIALLTGLLVFWFAYSPVGGRAGMVAAALLAGGIAVAVAAAAQSLGRGTLGATLGGIFDEPPEARLWSLLGAVCGMASVTIYPLFIGPLGIGLGFIARRLGAKQTGAAAMLLAFCGAAAGVLVAARIGTISIAVH